MKVRFVGASVICYLLSIGAAFADTAPILPLFPASVSTVPAAIGDVNPYGVTFVPRSVPGDGALRLGDVLVSNFNNSANIQGTGASIVRIDQHGTQSLFFHSPQSPSATGLTAALGILSNGMVLAGTLPTADGTAATVQPGALLIINRSGKLVSTLTDAARIDGPWGMAVSDRGNGNAQIFISNVLNGTIERLDIKYDDGNVKIVNGVAVSVGFNHRVDPAALVLGPSGLAYDAQHDTLYAASSADNAVYALTGVGSRKASAGAGKPIYADNVHLHGPLSLVLLPNGHLLVANSDGSNVDTNQPSELVEFTTNGAFVAQFSIDKNNGAAFGVSLISLSDGVSRVAAVNDNANTLSTWAIGLR